jgi:hypothetical protein
MLILASAQWTWCLVHVREQKATKTVWKCNEDLKKFIHVKQEARNQRMSFMEQHVGLQQRCAELDSGDDEDSSWDHFHLEHVSEFTRVNSRVDETFQKVISFISVSFYLLSYFHYECIIVAAQLLLSFVSAA